MKRLLALILACPLAALPPWLPPDKVGHFVGGMAIGATVTVAFRWTGGTPKQSARIGFAVGCAEGIRKEYLDSMSNADANAWGLRPVHAVEKADAGATAAGALVGSWITYEIIKDRK